MHGPHHVAGLPGSASGDPGASLRALSRLAKGDVSVLASHDAQGQPHDRIDAAMTCFDTLLDEWFGGQQRGSRWDGPLPACRDAKRSVWPWLRAPEDSPGPAPSLAGFMNYLHAHQVAPWISSADDPKVYEVPVAWRLLWADDRYRDGTTPPEEAHYRRDWPRRPVPRPRSA